MMRESYDCLVLPPYYPRNDTRELRCARAVIRKSYDRLVLTLHRMPAMIHAGYDARELRLPGTPNPDMQAMIHGGFDAGGP